LRYVAPPPGRKDAENCKWLMEQIVYLPIHAGQNDKDFRETVDRTIESYHKLNKYLSSPEIAKPIH
jgi:ribosomal protein S15P/S13E